MITFVYIFVVNNLLFIPWTQGLNQKHEEYSDTWYLGFNLSQNTDYFKCAV